VQAGSSASLSRSVCRQADQSGRNQSTHVRAREAARTSDVLCADGFNRFGVRRIGTKIQRVRLVTPSGGQIGYGFNNVLLYATGGAAVTGDSYRILDAATGALAATASDDTRWGGTIGAGVEVAPNWSVGVEYDHLFMQDSTVAFTTPAGAGFSDRIRQDVDVVTARINYKFGGPVVAKY
jgi:hypothetical protein